MPGWLWILCAAAALLLLYLVAVGLLVQRAAVRRSEARDGNFDPRTDDPATFGPTGTSPFRVAARDGNVWWNSQPLERFEIGSAEGLRLVGHLLRAAPDSNRLALVIHGHRCVSGEMGFIARMYHGWGYHVFMPDQRAHGKSEGTYIGMGYFEGADMLRWIALLRREMGADCKIVLHGISMGAATVMMLAGEEPLPPQVVCGVEDCGYTTAFGSIYHHARRDFSWLPLKKAAVWTAGLINKALAGYAFPACDCLAPLRRSRLPMLFIHGTNDDVVPFSMLRELCDAHGGEKDILVVTDAAHGVAYFQDTPGYTAAVKRFTDLYTKSVS